MTNSRHIFHDALYLWLSLWIIPLQALGGTGAQSDHPSAHTAATELQSFTVHGSPIDNAGVTATVLDSAARRENLTHSMADVLAQNSSVFVKSYGRGTLATLSVRGTAPSHTQVLWNGMPLNSPMLGMTDLSLIPSYFIDRATLYHGTGSVGYGGGGFGGALLLNTTPESTPGIGFNYIQGISSFGTYDEFVKFDVGGHRLQSSTRFSHTLSDNDFPYRNLDKVGDEGQLYPTEHNRNGNYRDWHLQQDFGYHSLNGRHHIGWSLWLTDSRRGIPMLTVNYRPNDRSKNRQDELSLRTVANWDYAIAPTRTLSVKAGFVHSDLLYRVWNDLGTDTLNESLRASSRVHSTFGQATYAASYTHWRYTLQATSTLHGVLSNSSKYGTSEEGYTKRRVENTLYGSLQYTSRQSTLHPLQLRVDLRAQSYGRHLSPLIPALYADYLLSAKGNLRLKASLSRNYRYPTLNDLYFRPGGNDSLRPERGFTYEGSLSYRSQNKHRTLAGEIGAYDSRISEWILWLPAGNNNGYWTPMNVRRVHSYGVEARTECSWTVARHTVLEAVGYGAWTRSINLDDPSGWSDGSRGKQLVYVPEFSASATARLHWRGFALSYKFNYYSTRYTTSSNEHTYRTDYVRPYYMHDLYLEKSFALRWGGLSIKTCVYNLTGANYVSVLSRPMPRRNYSLFIGITPLWHHHKVSDQ